MDTYASQTLYYSREYMTDFFKLISGDFLITFISTMFVVFLIGMILGFLYNIIKG